MVALCGGDVYIHHARVVSKDLRTYGVPLSICTHKSKLEEVREWLRQYYQAERIILCYDSVDDRS